MIAIEVDRAAEVSHPMFSLELLRIIRDEREREIRDRLRIVEVRRAMRDATEHPTTVTPGPTGDGRLPAGAGPAAVGGCR